MRIGIDLRSLEGGVQHRGIGRYATQLIEAVSLIDHKNEYVFFISSPQALSPKFNFGKAFQHRHIPGKGVGLRGVKYVRLLYLNPRPLQIDRYNLDVFLHIDIYQPIVAKTTPVVSVLYDLIPFIYKDLYQHVLLNSYAPKELISYARLKLKWLLAEKSLKQYKRSACIISISEHSKQDLLQFVPNITPENIVSIPLASYSESSSRKGIGIRIKMLGLSNFLFYVGGADPRKGLVDMAISMKEVWEKHPEVQLVIAGKEVTDPDVPEAVRLADAIDKLSRPKQVFMLGFLEHAELNYLYTHAAAFVFPSRYEGFGLPILEAMQAGCPVIAYDNSSIPEVAGDAALLVKDGESMVPAINKVLSDDKLRNDLIAKGKQQAKKFTWEKTARETLEVLEKVARKEMP